MAIETIDLFDRELLKKHTSTDEQLLKEQGWKAFGSCDIGKIYLRKPARSDYTASDYWLKVTFKTLGTSRKAFNIIDLSAVHRRYTVCIDKGTFDNFTFDRLADAGDLFLSEAKYINEWYQEAYPSLQDFVLDQAKTERDCLIWFSLLTTDAMKMALPPITATLDALRQRIGVTIVEA